MKYYAGVDLGGTFIKCGITDETGEILVRDKIPTGRERPYREIAADMAELVLSLSSRAGVTPTAAGIGSPGTVDSERGTIVYSNNIEWKNVPLGRAVSEKLGIPVYVTNDANAAALGESFKGAGRKYSSIILITLGTGVGGGIILDGRLFEGGKSAGAEIGHMVIRAGGEKCTCGRKGCFEAYASATALVSQTKAAMSKDKESVMWRLAGGDLSGADGRTAFDGMREGDKTARRVVKKYVGYLAEGVANLADIFRPDAILLGGGVCAEGEALLRPLRRKVNRLLFGGCDYAPVRIERAELGNDAGLCGAARLAMIRADCDKADKR